MSSYPGPGGTCGIYWGVVVFFGVPGEGGWSEWEGGVFFGVPGEGFWSVGEGGVFFGVPGEGGGLWSRDISFSMVL